MGISGHLQILSAPSLPREYWQFVDEGTIQPDECPCVLSAVTKKPVTVSDVQDARWYKFRKVAETFGLRSAYAFPVLSANDKVLAVLGTYYKKAYKADAYELDILQQLASLFALILEKRMVEEKITETKERYEFIKSATNEMIWGIDLKTGKVELSNGWTRLFGYELPAEDISRDFWYEKAHPDDREKAKEFFSNVQKNNKSHITEYRLQKANGTYAFVQATAYLIANDLDEPVRLIGSIKDITKQKELEQQLLLEETNKQKLINEAILEGSERQRSEISKELHDNVSQILSSAKLYLEMAMKKEKIQSELFNKSIEFINNGINEIRKLSHTLAPPGLRQLGLQDAIEEHLRNLHMVHPMKISFTFSKGIEKLASEELKLSLYRIIQEQLNNIVKYAQAQKVKIRLAKEKKQLILSIADNGVGFDLDHVKKGLGLANIVNRAALFEGNASIETSPGKGCSIHISIPLN